MRPHRVVSIGFLGLALGSTALAIRLGQAAPTAGARGALHRIVAGSPALVEILFAIGAGDRVVGRSHFTTEPREALRLPDVGGALDPNLEAIEAVRPDGLLLQLRSDALDAFATQRGIAVEHFKIETIADVLAATRRLGKLTEHEREAAIEVDRLSRAIAAARAAGPRVRPRVLLSSERDPGELRGVATLGAGTFVMECLEVAGGSTALPGSRGYAPITKEAIVEAKPDVVIELRTDPASPEVVAALVRDWEVTFPDLPAVRDRRIRVVAHEAALTPGPRLDQVIAALARALEAGP
jgi:iron complex transport system substrate-binding protein